MKIVFQKVIWSSFNSGFTGKVYVKQIRIIKPNDFVDISQCCTWELIIKDKNGFELMK